MRKESNMGKNDHRPPRPRERQAIALALPAMLVIAGAAIWAVVAAVQWVMP